MTYTDIPLFFIIMYVWRLPLSNDNESKHRIGYGFLQERISGNRLLSYSALEYLKSRATNRLQRRASYTSLLGWFPSNRISSKGKMKWLVNLSHPNRKSNSHICILQVERDNHYNTIKASCDHQIFLDTQNAYQR